MTKLPPPNSAVPLNSSHNTVAVEVVLFPCRCSRNTSLTVTRKLGLDPSVARRKVDLLAEFDVVAPDVSDILAAIDLHRLQQISFWDALVVRAAGQAGCVVLFSEDMQDRREVDGVRIVNPFQ